MTENKGRHRNPKDYADEIKKIVDDSMDVTQIDFPDHNERKSDFDVESESKDLTPDAFTEKGTDYPSDESIGANPELPVGKSMTRFSKKHDVPESAKVQGNKSSGLKGE